MYQVGIETQLPILPQSYCPFHHKEFYEYIYSLYTDRLPEGSVYEKSFAFTWMW